MKVRVRIRNYSAPSKIYTEIVLKLATKQTRQKKSTYLSFLCHTPSWSCHTWANGTSSKIHHSLFPTLSWSYIGWSASMALSLSSCSASCSDTVGTSTLVLLSASKTTRGIPWRDSAFSSKIIPQRACWTSRTIHRRLMLAKLWGTVSGTLPPPTSYDI